MRQQLPAKQCALQATLKDAEFLAKKVNFDIDPVAGEEPEEIVHSFFTAGPNTLNRLKEIST